MTEQPLPRPPNAPADALNEELVVIEPTPEERRAARIAHAQQAWQRLGDAMRSITPSALARFCVSLFAIGLILWVISKAWTALIPFQIGIVLAYLLLPLVNRLERYMPRWAAILFTFVTGLVVIWASLAYLTAPLSDQIRRLFGSLPNSDSVDSWLAQIELLYANLPPEWRPVIDDGINQFLAFLRTNVAGYLRTTFTFLLTTTFSLINTATFLFGFLVVPFWLFFVMNDYHKGTKAVDRLLASWLRADFWAVLRIVDRIFSKYIRGQLLLGVIIAIAAYLGLTILKFAGVGGIQYELLLALIAGVTELVPLIGPVIGAIPAVILGFTDSWQSGLAILALYIAIQQLENNFLVPRVQGESIEIHPAVLSAALVALSQFGFLWLVLAAPLVAIIRDLFRYLYGRLGDPPSPAGVIPGDPVTSDK
jgi:predicted PurR-regulated permease PerM